MKPRFPLPPLEEKPVMPFPDPDDNPERLQRATQNLLAAATTGNAASLSGYSGLKILNVVDPSTGDSIIHRAASVGNIDFLDGIYRCFGREFSIDPRRSREFWVLLMHQNFAGDTSLHTAARCGNLQGAKGVYRLLMYDSLPDDDHNEDFPPAEEWEWNFEEESDLEFVYKAVVLVCAKNRDGRDAAAEARAGGHDALAKWFEDLLQKIDPDGKWEDENYMKLSWNRVLYYNYYLQGEEKKEEDVKEEES